MTTMHLSPEARQLPFGLDRLAALLPAHTRKRRISLFGLIIAAALVSFEMFNFSTTEFALNDLLGNLTFLGLPWSVILALAFCGMDFAGIAKLLTLDRSSRSFEVWYLLGAWLLAAAMNAMLSWWSISLALISHEGLGNEVLGREALIAGVPVFVALLVVLLRILIIGTLSLSGSSLFITSKMHPVQEPDQKSEEHLRMSGTKTAKSGSGASGTPAASRIPTRSPIAARAARR